MCGRDKAGVLFADFKAAFPSILAEWIFAVLVAMGVRSETVDFFKALCANNAALACFEGAAETVFPVERGARLGGPCVHDPLCTGPGPRAALDPCP
eukprot:9477183-Pyramimonas_sp.AAC.1